MLEQILNQINNKKKGKKGEETVSLLHVQSIYMNVTVITLSSCV